MRRRADFLTSPGAWNCAARDGSSPIDRACALQRPCRGYATGARRLLVGALALLALALLALAGITLHQ